MMIMTMLEKLLLFLISKIPPEVAHKVTIFFLKYGLNKSIKPNIEPNLKINLFGRSLSNPIGLAAGFDKNAEALKGLLKLNFSFIEVGTVTPEPQLGNRKPRVFRLKKK